MSQLEDQGVPASRSGSCGSAVEPVPVSPVPASIPDAAHTPGPWAVEEPMDHELMIVEDGKQAYEWRTIAGCPWPTDRGDISRKQVKANARLIAAAPELLEALKVMTEFAEGVVQRMKLTDTNGIVAASRAAIAKATGGAA